MNPKTIIVNNESHEDMEVDEVNVLVTSLSGSHVNPVGPTQEDRTFDQ
jgi:hypothetical protein